MSAERHIPAFTWAHCWNSAFLTPAWQRIRVRVFTLHSHPRLTPSPLCISHFHQMLRELSYDFLVSLPLHSASLTQSDKKGACDFPWLFLRLSLSPSTPFISLFCHPWQLRRTPKPVLSLGTVRWAGLQPHLSAQCEQHSQLPHHLH